MSQHNDLSISRTGASYFDTLCRCRGRCLECRGLNVLAFPQADCHWAFEVSVQHLRHVAEKTHLNVGPQVKHMFFNASPCLQ